MLAIGRALMARPKLLLLDEPSMGLAPIFVEQDLRDHPRDQRAGDDGAARRAERADGARDGAPRLRDGDRPHRARRRRQGAARRTSRSARPTSARTKTFTSAAQEPAAAAGRTAACARPFSSPGSRSPSRPCSSPPSRLPASARRGHTRRTRPSAPTSSFLMTDDQTLENMRVMPNVQRLLGEEGATFTQYVVSYSLCCPSRATMMTGQYAHNHRVLGNALPNGGFYRFRADNSLPVWLQDGGYYTAHVGKFLNGYGRKNPTQVPPGWNEWYTTIDPTTYRYWNYTMNENGKLVKHGERDAGLHHRLRRAPRCADHPRPRREPAAQQEAALPPGRTSSRRTAARRRARRPAAHGHARAGAAAPRPVRLHPAADAAELQRGGRQGQAPGRPPPRSDRRLRPVRDHRGLPAAARVAARRRRRSRRDRAGARPRGRARQHVHLLHLRQRVLPGRAPDPQRQGAAVRGVDPPAAARPRPGHRARHGAAAAGRRTSTSRRRSPRWRASSPA